MRKIELSVAQNWNGFNEWKMRERKVNFIGEYFKRTLLCPQVIDVSVETN